MRRDACPVSSLCIIRGVAALFLKPACPVLMLQEDGSAAFNQKVDILQKMLMKEQQDLQVSVPCVPVCFSKPILMRPDIYTAFLKTDVMRRGCCLRKLFSNRVM